jgi:peroxiredoxin
MKNARNWVPVLGMLALAALFLKMPEIANVFGNLDCKTCSSSDPYLPLLGAGYFALLVAISLLFPSFPGPRFSRSGLIWATLLALALTYIDWPRWCMNCLIAHMCNILIWAIWVAIPPGENDPSASTLRERSCLAVFAPISVVALFSCLNLTFMAYGFRSDRNFLVTTLHAGDAVPTFATQNNNGRSITNNDAEQISGLIINFISQDCPYCKEQLKVVEAVSSQLVSGSYRFINVSPTLSPELIQRWPTAEWVEDKKGKLRELFHVSGYPTMFIVGKNGKIEQVVSGVSDELQANLLSSLVKPQTN